MNNPIFYAPADSISSESIVLNKPETHHAVKVMRLKKGNLVTVIDGIGNGYHCEILKIPHNSGLELRVLSRVRNFGEPDVRVTLACGLSTGYKFDTVVEKGTELGVSRFVPLMTEKSKIKLEDPKRTANKISRYEKVALAATKQCRRSIIPQISEPISFQAFLNQLDSSDRNFLFSTTPNTKSLVDSDISDSTRRVTLIVGPESGFSSNEIDLALENNIELISLGKRILRTETAGIVVSALILSLLGELN